jgi:glutamate-1-semialdehyde 2,1-aminomutase
LCTDNGIPLIFDEVKTGFRLAAGGVQERLSYSDIVCFGKVIMEVYRGAFAARAEIMNYLMSFTSGTLSGNPLAMAAGLAMLKALDADRDVFID